MANSEQETSSSPGTLLTYVGHIGDPKADQPVATRVVEPAPETRQYLRGNLYSVVELVGDSPQRSQMADRLLSVIQRTYYAAKGSQSQVIRQALDQATQLLAEYNAQAGAAVLHADIICAALLRNRLVVLTTGSAVALIMTGEKVHIFPPNVASAPPGPGGSPPGEPEIFREEVRAGDALFLGGGGWLDLVPIRTLASTVAYVTAGNCAAAAQGLYEMTADAELPGLLVVLAAGAGDGGATAPGASPLPPPPPPRPRRTLWRGLPTAVGSQVLVRPPTTAATSASAAALGDPMSEPGATAALAMAADEAGGESLPSAGGEGLATDSQTPPVDQASEGWLKKVTVGAAAATAAGWSRLRTFLGTMLPDRRQHQAAVAVSAGSVAVASAQTPPSLAGQPPAADAALISPEPEFGADEAGDIDPSPAPPAAPDLPPFAPPQPTSGGRARLFIAIAIVIAVLIPAVVSALPRGQPAEPQADVEQLLSLARAQYLSAMDALEAGNEENARSQLTKAEELLFSAQQVAGPSPAIDELAGQVREARNEVEHRDLLYGLVDPLVTFPTDADPHRVLVVDQDVYVLDTGRQLIQRYRLDDTGTLVPDQEGETVLSEGDVVDGATVGRLTAMAWQPIVPGVEDKANLLVLDRNNNVFVYNDRVDGARRLEFGSQADWRSPSLLQSYAGRVYVADEGAGQIYRYSAGAYGDAPYPWFGEGNQASLAGTVSMGIDGDIWLMVDTGMVLRFSDGAQIPFSLDQRLGPTSEPVDLAIGSDVTNLIYLADAAEERVVVYDKAGAYLRQYAASEGNPLTGLAGIYVDEVGGYLYLLTQSALYKHPLPS